MTKVMTSMGRKNTTSTNQIPKTVEVGPYNFDVKIVDNAGDHIGDGKPMEEGNIVYGCMKMTEQKIFMSAGQADIVMADTLLHEVMHAIWAVSGATATDLNEEYIVSAFTTILLQTLRRNPEFTRYIAEL